MDKIKVLLIDDDTLFGNMVTFFLIEKGFDVLYLNSLIAVEAVISQFQPSIILLDVEIGTDDGLLFPKYGSFLMKSQLLFCHHI